jgi:hypothetical protein
MIGSTRSRKSVLSDIRVEVSEAVFHSSARKQYLRDVDVIRLKNERITCMSPAHGDGRLRLLFRMDLGFSSPP